MIKPKKVLFAVYLLIASTLIGFVNSFMVFGFTISFLKLFSLVATYSIMAILIYFINIGN